MYIYTADVVTPEALILALHHGSGVLLIKSDEFKVGEEEDLKY
jgi:hypothetical protein